MKLESYITKGNFQVLKGEIYFKDLKPTDFVSAVEREVLPLLNGKDVAYDIGHFIDNGAPSDINPDYRTILTVELGVELYKKSKNTKIASNGSASQDILCYLINNMGLSVPQKKEFGQAIPFPEQYDKIIRQKLSKESYLLGPREYLNLRGKKFCELDTDFYEPILLFYEDSLGGRVRKTFKDQLHKGNIKISRGICMLDSENTRSSLRLGHVSEVSKRKKSSFKVGAVSDVPKREKSSFTVGNVSMKKIVPECRALEAQRLSDLHNKIGCDCAVNIHYLPMYKCQGQFGDVYERWVPSKDMMDIITVNIEEGDDTDTQKISGGILCYIVKPC